jgi:hypothetical protein
MSLSMKNTNNSNLNALLTDLSFNFMFLEKYKLQMNADERRYAHQRRDSEHLHLQFFKKVKEAYVPHP